MTKKQTHENGWPSHSGSLFVDGDDPDLDILFMQLTGFEIHYISAFKSAADVVIDSILTNTGLDRHPEMFISAAYLYRQSLELQMKYIMKMSNQIGRTEFTTQQLLGHNLVTLWRHTSAALVQIWPKGSTQPLDFITGIIREFDAIDETGQEFRYATRTNNTESLNKLPRFPDAGILKQTIGKAHEFLGSCSSGLDTFFDQLNSCHR
ncbi:hypothetical protein [Symmachiella dynata]|uniref:hypothetical protein n=1 Tax=Symmachiella dynata TaxID=2527995 RepID=UPI0030EC4F37